MQPLRQPHVVLVCQRNVADPAKIALAQQADEVGRGAAALRHSGKHANRVAGCAPLLQPLQGAVIRAVVRDQDRDAYTFLRQYRIHLLVEPGAGVVGGHQHEHARRRTSVLALAR